MYSVLVFLFTFTQLALVGLSYFLAWPQLFQILLIYGSPIHLFMTLLSAGSALMDASWIYPALLVYHLIKYLLMFLCQINEGFNRLFLTAVVFETIYLVASGYYLN